MRVLLVLLKFSLTHGLQDVATSLPQCGSIPITVSASNSATAYYMIALPVGGIPTTTLIGTSQDSLTWVVNQPAGMPEELLFTSAVPDVRT